MTIPEHLVPTVERALRAAFGTATYDDVSALGGIRAFACRIVVHGRRYVLRVGASTSRPTTLYCGRPRAIEPQRGLDFTGQPMPARRRPVIRWGDA